MSLVLLDNADIGRKRRVLVRKACLTVDSGDIVRIVGANGTGKSTLVSTILGSIRPLSGRRGNALPSFGSAEHQRFFGYLPATVRPLPSLTVKQWFQAIDSGLELSSGTAELIWDRLEGRALPGSTLESLSSGNLRKALAVNAFAIRRELLILDEPFEELDSDGRLNLRQLIDEQAYAGAKVLLISHSECGPVTRTYAINGEQLALSS